MAVRNRQPRLRKLVVVTLIAATCAGLSAMPAAASGPARHTASVQSNLCKLKVAKQLRALGIRGGRCTPQRALRLGNSLLAKAAWAKAGTGVSVTTYRGLSMAHFTGVMVPPHGLAVRVGSYARAASEPTGFVLSAWIRGVAVIVELSHQGSKTKNMAYRGRVIAFTRAVAKQI